MMMADRVEDRSTLPKTGSGPTISQARLGREQAERLPRSRWSSLATAEEWSRIEIQQLMRFVFRCGDVEQLQPTGSSASQRKRKNTPTLI